MFPKWFRSRYWILVAAVLMQMCLGATYSWSVFVDPLRKLLDLKQGTAQTPFTIFYMVFPATALFAGPAMARLTPRWSAVLGGLIFGGGWMVASLGSRGFPWTILGIGVLGGVGVGLAYVVPIATCIQWFPRHKGFVTGIAVAGFGGGAAAVGEIGSWLMTAHAATPFHVFRVLGLAYLILIGVAGLVMRRPVPVSVAEPDGKPTKTSTTTPKSVPRFLDIVTQRPFQILYMAMVCGLVAGFTVNANLKQLSPGATARAGVLAVSLFALANAAGRIVWGAIFDRVSRPIRALQANLILQAAVLFASLALLRSEFGLWIIAAAAGFNYGGVLVLYASSVASRWGAERVGHIYGWMFSSNIPAAVAPLLAGFAFDWTGSFTIALAVVGGILLMGAAIVSRVD